MADAPPHRMAFVRPLVGYAVRGARSGPAPPNPRTFMPESTKGRKGAPAPNLPRIWARLCHLGQCATRL